MNHPEAFDPRTFASFQPEKMSKTTIFQSSNLLVGINAFEPGQVHALHTHNEMDKAYYVLEGSGHFLLQDREMPVNAGEMMIAPEGVGHGVRNDGDKRLVVLSILSPSPVKSANENRP